MDAGRGPAPRRRPASGWPRPVVATVVALGLMIVWSSEAVSLGSVLDVGRYERTQTAVASTIALTSRAATDFGTVEEGTCYTRPGFMSSSYATRAQPTRVSCDEPHSLELVAVITVGARETVEPAEFMSECVREIDWQVAGPLPEGLEPASFPWMSARWEGQQQGQALCFVVGQSTGSVTAR